MDGLVVHAPRLPPRSTKWVDDIRNRLIGRKVTRFWLGLPRYGGARSTIASKVEKMGGSYKKPFDRPQSYTVFGRIPCNGRSGGARSTIASKVEKMGGSYKKPFDRSQRYTVLARIACNGRSGGTLSTIASKVYEMGG